MNEKATRKMQSYTENSAFFIYAAKKTERLSRAIYLITNFFSDNEPIKWKLRTESISLLEIFSRFTSPTEAHHSVDVSLLKHTLRNSLATLGVAHTAGLISEMNFGILRHEYEALLDELESELGQDGKHSPLLFPKDFFAVTGENRLRSGTERYLYGTTFDSSSEREKKETSQPTTQSIEARAEVKDGEEVKLNKQNSATPKGHSKPIKDIKDIKRTDTAKATPTPSTSLRTNRRDIIIQLIKDKKEISVKDVAREVQEVSEKTLQREMVGMVEEGVLERVGSRRWSRYRFANST